MQNTNYFLQAAIFIFVILLAGFICEKAIIFSCKKPAATFLFVFLAAIIITIRFLTGTNHA